MKGPERDFSAKHCTSVHSSHSRVGADLHMRKAHMSRFNFSDPRGSFLHVESVGSTAEAHLLPSLLLFLSEVAMAIIEEKNINK